MDEKERLALRKQCEELGETKVREKLHMLGEYLVTETPVVKAWLEEKHTDRMERAQNKLRPRDYIGWGLFILSMIVTVVFAQKNAVVVQKNRGLENRQNIVRSSVQNINQYNVTNNYNLPGPIKTEINNIAQATGSTVTLDGERATLDGEPFTIQP